MEKQREKPGEENRMEIRVDRYDGDNKSSQPTFSRSSALCERGKVVRKSKSCSLVPLLFLTLQTAAASLSFASPHFLLSGIECFSQGIPKGVKVSTVMILRILPSPPPPRSRPRSVVERERGRSMERSSSNDNSILPRLVHRRRIGISCEPITIEFYRFIVDR